MSAEQCSALGGTQTLGSCDDPGVQTACRSSNIRKPCKTRTWKLAKRPTEHNTGFANPIRTGWMEIVSETPERTKDAATTAEECKYNYGWLQKSATGHVMEGRMCNTYNRQCAGFTKRAQRLRLVRSAAGGTMEFQGSYRPPCPEESEMGCATTVGC